MAEDVYFAGADCRVSVKPKGVTDAMVLCAVHGWSFNLKFESNDLYGSSSIFMIASARYQQSVEAKLKYSCFNPGASGWIAEAIAGDAPTGYDSARTKGIIKDTSRYKTATISGSAAPFKGASSVVFGVDILDAVFEQIPFNLEENNWIALDLAANGSDIKLVNTGIPKPTGDPPWKV